MNEVEHKNSYVSEESISDERITQIEEQINWLERSNKKAEKIIGFRQLVIIVCLGIIVSILILQQFSNTEHYKSNSDTLTSNYAIFDMKGDQVSTWIVWKTVKGDLFHINVVESPEVTSQRLEDINDVVFSNQTLVINGQTYYEGWRGALGSIKTSEIFPIPTRFRTMTTDTKTGNIIIELTNAENGDGYTGFTKTIADASNNEALKSQITVYGVDKLTDDELKIILRHELGHAFGIMYSNNPDDVMHLTVSQDRPYISPCDIQTIEALYNGQEKSTVVCTS